MYDSVRANVQRYAAFVSRPLVRAQRYRSLLARRIRVEVEGVLQIPAKRPGAAGVEPRLLQAVRYESVMDQIHPHHPDPSEVRAKLGERYLVTGVEKCVHVGPVVQPHRNGVARRPRSVGYAQQLVGRLHYVLRSNHALVLTPWPGSSAGPTTEAQGDGSGMNRRSPTAPSPANRGTRSLIHSLDEHIRLFRLSPFAGRK